MATINEEGLAIVWDQVNQLVEQETANFVTESTLNTTVNNINQTIEQSISEVGTNPKFTGYMSLNRPDATVQDPIGTNSVSLGTNNIATGNSSIAEGYNTKSKGTASHSEGSNTQSIADNAHAEGNLTEARGATSHAEGYSTHANGISSHAEGNTTQATGAYSHAEGNNTQATSSSSHAEGSNTKATGEGSHAEGGLNTTASGQFAHAEGLGTTAQGAYSHAEGHSTTAIGVSSHVEGETTQAVGSHSHAEGDSTQAIGNASHTEGQNTIVTQSAVGGHAEGIGNTVAGLGNNNPGQGGHVEGIGNTSLGDAQHVQGKYAIQNPNMADIVGNGTDNNNRSNAYSLDWEGNGIFAGKITIGTNPSNDMDVATKKYVDDNIIDTNNAVIQTPTETDETYELLFSESADNIEHTEGTRKTKYATINPNKAAFTFGSRFSGNTVGSYSVAEGSATTASGDYSHAEGNGTFAIGLASHAEGDGASATAAGAHGEGFGSTATNSYAHAEGYMSTSSGYASHAENCGTASGDYSHAEGVGTVAQRAFQHVFGTCNELDTKGADGTERGKYIEIVGKGRANNNRSNARTLDWNGNEELAGNLTVNNDIISNQPWTGSYTSLKKIIDILISNLPNGIYLEDNVTLKVGESVNLQSLVIPANTPIEWTVDNIQDVSVDNGIVTAIANNTGVATVTATISGTQTYVQCRIDIVD